MKINSYSFGKIVIDGKEYTRDVKLTGKRVIPNWWRREGHHLYLEDLKDILEEKPEFLVVGTGYFGLMKVDREVEEYCSRESIQLIACRSSRAVDEYNRLVQEGRKVCAAFHLTC